jgi:hypothetical protein
MALRHILIVPVLLAMGACTAEDPERDPSGGSPSARPDNVEIALRWRGRWRRDLSPSPSPTTDMAVSTDLTPIPPPPPPPADMAPPPPPADMTPAASDPTSAPPPPACPAPTTATANSTTPGAIRAPNPTLRNLTIEWLISGDADNDGVVTVRYRPQGSTVWRAGMPLRRTPAGSNLGFSWANRHSGSLFDLQPDTTYEVELALRDPDGGCDTRTITVRTRAIPAPSPTGTVRPVTPATFASIANSASPGDILELAAGTYAGFTFGRDGQPGSPIVIRSTAGAVVNGNIELGGRHDVILTGLDVRGRIRFNGGRNLAITRNRVTTSSDGIVAYTRAEDCYIADNVVTGATVWDPSSLGVNGNNIGEGILVTGPGHVVEHNRVSGFRDALSLLEESEAVDQWSIDFIENDVSSAADDGVEADFCFHNCRVVRNRFTNVFIAMSSQPGLGGPTYFIRNVAYNVVLQAFKLHRSSVGDVVLHNTVVKSGDANAIFTGDPIERALFRNNLFIGGPGGTYGGYASGSGDVIDIASATTTCDFDYDALGSTAGTFTGKLGAARFSDLAGLQSMTTEKHARRIDLTVFAATVAYPAQPFPGLVAADLRLRATGGAVDVGVAIPNVNDGFAGAAPDVGAYEAGAAIPAYGPR